MLWMEVEDPDQLPIAAVPLDASLHAYKITRDSFYLDLHCLQSYGTTRRIILCIIRGPNSKQESTRFFKYTDKEQVEIFIPEVYRGYTYDCRILGQDTSTWKLTEHLQLEVRTPRF